jgi:hypothetical protein
LLTSLGFHKKIILENVLKVKTQFSKLINLLSTISTILSWLLQKQTKKRVLDTLLKSKESKENNKKKGKLTYYCQNLGHEVNNFKRLELFHLET